MMTNCSKKINKRYLRKPLYFLFTLLSFTVAFAADSTSLSVNGKGESYELAVQDALSTAIKLNNGITLYSRSRSINGNLEEDKTLSSSAGHVNDYWVIDNNIIEGVHHIALQVDLNNWPMAVESFSQDSLIAPLKQGLLIAREQQTLKEQSDMLSAYLGSPQDYLANAYNISISNMTVFEVAPEKITGEYLIKIIPNLNFWKTYYLLIQSMDYSMNEKTYPEDEFKKIKDTVSDCRYCIGFQKPATYLLKSLSPYAARPIEVNLSMHQNTKKIFLYKNAVVLQKSQYKQDIKMGKIEETDVLLVSNYALKPMDAFTKKNLDVVGVAYKDTLTGLFTSANQAIVGYIKNHDKFLIKLPFNVKSMSNLLSRQELNINWKILEGGDA
jgi:hypothetical protein